MMMQQKSLKEVGLSHGRQAGDETSLLPQMMAGNF